MEDVPSYRAFRRFAQPGHPGGARDKPLKRLYLDSSALAKRYVREPGSERVAACCRQADEILLSVISAPELISGFNRLWREGKLSRSRYWTLKRRLAADARQATIVDLGPAVVGRAIACLERVPLRTLDAIHVASAIESMCDLFLTADRQQHQAAARLNLAVELIGEDA